MFALKIENTFTEDEPHTSKDKKWTTTKKPHTGKNIDNTDYLKLKHERKMRRDAIHKRLAKRGEEVRALANIRQAEIDIDRKIDNIVESMKKSKMAESKERARAAYTARVDKRRRLYPTSLLDPKNKMPNNIRMRLYQRYHKCGCVYMKKELLPNVMLISPEKIEMTCNHKRSKQIPSYTPQLNLRCSACGASISRAFKSPCSCYYVRCWRCQRDNFIIKHEGKIVTQLYDKHTSPLGHIHVSTDRNDNAYLDFMMVNEQQTKNKPDIQQISKDDFLNELQGKKKKSRWDIVPSTSTDKAPQTNDAEFPPLSSNTDFPPLSSNDFPPLIKTEPEGGSLSSLSAGVSSASNTVKAKLKELKDATFGKIREYTEVASKTKKDATYLSRFVSFLKTIKYYLDILVDYLMALNPITLAMMLYDLQQGNYIKAIGQLISTYPNLKIAEELSKQRILTRVQHPCFRERDFLEKERYEQLDLGVLQWQFFYKYQELRKTAERYTPARLTLTTLESIGWTSAQAQNFTPTIPQSNEGILSSAFTLLQGLFRNVPSKFAHSAKFIAKLCKEYLPILSGIKLASDTYKICDKLVSRIIEWITGTKKNTNEWIVSEIKRPDSPLQELIAAITEYFASNQPTNKRSELFDLLSAAQNYALAEGHYNVHWLRFHEAVSKNISDPPKPAPREREPTSVSLVGAAGVGKTTTWKALIAPHISNKSTGQEKLIELETVTHTWNPTSTAHQVGLSEARVVLFDDIGQNRDANEIQHFMRLVSCASFPIDSPSITGREVKGVLADPEFVVCTSNDTANTTGNLVLSSDAYYRRFDIEFHLLKKYDPANPNEKIARVKRSVFHGSLVGKEFSFSEMNTLVTITHRKKQDRLAEVDEIVSNLAEEMMTTSITPTQDTIPQTYGNAWQEVGDILKDFKKYITDYDKPDTDKDKKDDEDDESEEEETDEEDNSTITASPATIADFLPGHKEIVKTKEEAGLVSPYERVIARDMWTTGLIASVPISMIYGFVQVHNALNSWYSSFMDAYFTRSFMTRTLSSVFATLSTLVVSTSLAIISLRYLANPAREESGEHHAKKASRIIPTVAQAGNDNTLSLIKQATGSIQTDQGKIMNCIFIGGHYILTAAHFFRDFNTDTDMEEGTMIGILKKEYNGNIKRFRFEKENIVSLDKFDISYDDNSYVNDVIIYKLPSTQFNASRKLYHHFFDGKIDLLNHQVEKIDFIPYSDNGSPICEFSLCRGKVTKDVVNTRRSNGKTVYFHRLVQSDYASRAASCGSAVRMTNVQNQPILGIHVSRGLIDNTSQFHLVTRGGIERALAKFEAPIDVDQTLIDTSAQEGIAKVTPNPPLSVLGYVGKVSKMCYRPSKTELTKSLVFECYSDSITQPAVLSPFDERLDEAFQGEKFYKQLFKGYSLDTSNSIQYNDIKFAHHEMVRRLSRMSRYSIVRPKKLNLHEALNGIPYIPQNTRMEMSTSPGFPYVQEGFRKSDLFTIDTDGDIVPCERIKVEYNNAMIQLQNGIIPFTPFTISLKDERVKHKKINPPATRLFAGGNLISFLICRTYFYTILMQLYHQNLSHSFCVPSLDRLSLQWHDLMSYMTEVGTSGFDFDFKSFDRTLSKALLWAGADAMLKPLHLSSIEHNTVLEYITAPYCIWGNDVYQCHGVLMSGVLITYALNCVANELLHMAAWRSLMLESNVKLASYQYYYQYTRGIRGGDDTITCVDDRVLPFYNGKTVSQYLLSKGMLVTSPDKTSEIPESTHFLNLSFLKNCTSIKNNLYIPKPDLKSIIEISYYIRLSKDRKDKLKATEDNVLCTLRSLYFHGKQVYNDFRTKVLEVEPNLNLPFFQDLSEIWNKYHGFPGAHADYATSDDRDDIFVPDVILTTNEKPQPDISIKTMLEHIPPHTPVKEMASEFDADLTDTIPEDGRDTEAIESQDHPNVGATDEVSIHPTETSTDMASDSPGKSETQRVGTSIQDAGQRTDKTVVTGSVQISSRNDRAQTYLNDVDWDLNKLEHKFTHVRTVDWKITDPAYSLLTQFIIPKDIVVTPAQKAPFDVTKYWKASNVLMKVVVKGSRFYAGSLVLGFAPLDAGAADMRKLITMGAQVYKISKDESVEFSIPWRYPLGFLDIEKDRLGVFKIFVQSPLATGPDNPNAVSVSVYSAIEENKFKIPDIVPSNSYVSRKLDKNSLVVHTIPESGDLSTSNSNVIVDINAPVGKTVEEATMLCAGTGKIDVPSVGHFQDAPSDLVQLLKRWRITDLVRINVSPDRRIQLSFTYEQLVKVASDYLLTMFQCWRGSVDLRVSVFCSEPVEGTIFWAPRVAPNIPGNVATTTGIHTFDNHTVGQVTIPFVSPSFVETYEVMQKFAHPIRVFFDGQSDALAFVRFEVALGDDFHVGIFNGNSHPLTSNFKSLKPEASAAESPYSQVIYTVPEGGIFDFLGRALENTLPIAETVSSLGALLDAHMLTMQPEPIFYRKAPYSIATDIQRYTERLLTVNHNGMSLPDKECFGVSEGETNIYDLMTETKSFVKTLKWSETDAVGTQLNGSELSGGPSGNREVFHDTLPAMFHYWTGSTTYIFDIIASEMHRGQLMFAYSFDNETIPSYVDATQTYFTSYDLSAGRGTIAITLPYLHPRPYMNVFSGQATTGLQTSPGRLHVYVQNQLRSTATVSPSVEIMVYKTYGKDFRLGVYGNDQALLS